MNETPKWAIDLLIAVMEYEFTHKDIRDGAHCFSGQLELIPDDVMTKAKAVAEYKGVII